MHRLDISRPVTAFVRDRSGSIAIMSAMLLTLLLGFAGAAVDYGQMIYLRSRLQHALDAATLAASNPLITDDVRQDRFTKAFKANYEPRLKTPDNLTFTYTAGSGGKGSGSFVYDTFFFQALGTPFATVGATSAARFDQNDIEIVFALDISGSMLAADMGGGTRLNALKASVTKLMDIVMANKSPAQNVKFGVVPFNMAVNIGTDNAGLVEGTAHALFSGTEWGGCVLERPKGYHAKDTYSAGATNGSGRWPAYIWPPAPNSGYCLNPSNGTNAGYSLVEPAPLGKDPWKNGPNFNCPRYPLTRLTSSDSTVRAAVSGLDAWGNMGTTVGPAVGWAFRMLSPDGPFKDGAALDGKTRKVMVVVTDGEMVTDGSSCQPAMNSSSAYRFDPASLGLQGRVMTSAPTNDSFTPYGYILDSDPYNSGLASARDADKELDRLSIDACTEAKAKASGSAAIEIFTIAASTGAGPGTRAETVLSKCATSSAHFVYAADAATMDAAFEKIAEKALGLRLTN